MAAKQESETQFSARLPFDPLVPYDELFRERVPLVHALQVAIGNYVSNRANKRNPDDTRVAAIQSRVREKKFIAVECGVYLGSGLVAMARVLRDAGLKFSVYGLDTFEGLPPLSETDRSLAPQDSPYLRRKLFADTSLREVTTRLRESKLERHVTLVKGTFRETLPRLPEQGYHFANIDCDLYEPHLECLRYFYPRMEPGGIIFFDDYFSEHYPMAKKAIDDFLRDKPEKLFYIRYGEEGPNLTKTYLVKF